MAGYTSFVRTPDGAPSTPLTAALYFACSISLLAIGDSGGTAIFCCSDAVLLSALLLRPRSQWLSPVVGCMLAVFVANALTGRDFGVAALFAIGNMSAPVAAAALMRGAGGDQAARTDTPFSVARFVVIAGLLAQAIGASVGAATLATVFDRPLIRGWIQWYATESAGILLGTPLLLMLWRDELGGWIAELDRRRALASVALLLAVAAGSVVTFREGYAAFLFLPTTLVIIAAFCIGRVGAAVSVLLVAIIASRFDGHAFGQLSLIAGDRHLQILFLQTYLAIVLLTALPVAASLEESQRLQAALIASETRYRAMTDNSGDLITWVDPDGACRYASQAAVDMLGMAATDLVGRVVGDLIHADDIALVADHHRAALASQGEAQTIVYRAYHADGRMLWMEARTRAFFSEDGAPVGVQWTIRDVTAHKSIEAMLAEAANTDPLTGLANRRAFFSLLDISITRARALGSPLSLAIIDLDHFKRVNDQWGHDIGDAALRAFAKSCGRQIRGDDLLARLGGEEFALMMPATDLGDAQRICERIRAATAGLEIPVPDRAPIAITLSVGVTRLADDDDATALVRTADRALYAAKHDGRNCVQIAARDADRVPPDRR